MSAVNSCRNTKVSRNSEPRKRRFAKTRRGAAAVELAILAPFLMALLLGICEVGQAIRVEAILATAARSACAVASSPSGTNELAFAEVQTILQQANLPSDSVSVQVYVNNALGDASSAVSNDKITVTVKLPTSATRTLASSFFSSPNAYQVETTTMLRQ